MDIYYKTLLESYLNEGNINWKYTKSIRTIDVFNKFNRFFTKANKAQMGEYTIDVTLPGRNNGERLIASYMHNTRNNLQDISSTFTNVFINTLYAMVYIGIIRDTDIVMNPDIGTYEISQGYVDKNEILKEIKLMEKVCIKDLKESGAKLNLRLLKRIISIALVLQ